MTRLSSELRRQIGLVVSRKGEVVQVVTGTARRLVIPHSSRLRRGRTRLAGYYFLRTAFKEGLNEGDLTQLFRRRWDLVASVDVKPGGLPGLIHAAHLLPQAEDGVDYRLLNPFVPGHPPEDLSRLVRALEDELGRATGARIVEGKERALLVSVTTKSRDEAERDMAELEELVLSAGLEVAGRVIQRLSRLDSRTLLGAGKLDEVMVTALRTRTDLLIFDQNLSPSQAHRLALDTRGELRFLDRTQLILDIFAKRASTREGKLQVETAQLRYLSPRLASRDDGLSRLAGGIGGRGPGETKLETDRRRVRQRLHRLQNHLDQVAAQRSRRRQGRERAGLPVLSIVGYTNAGKSTLLNALTGSHVKTQDRLFATLDPTTRRLRFPREREVIITDTVGFIRDLPPELRRAFAATLEELHHADLLLHVADAANPRVDQQIKAVDAILDELDLTQVPRLIILNKQDAADSGALKTLVNRYQGVAVSAMDQESLFPLLAEIEKILFTGMLLQ